MPASPRCDALAVVAWDEAHKAAFLHMQCAAQHQFSQERSTRTDLLIMLRDAVPVGRLSVARWEDEFRIVDIALLPPYRHAGIGTAILRDILAEAAVAQKPAASMSRNSTRPYACITSWALSPLPIRGCICSWSGLLELA